MITKIKKEEYRKANQKMVALFAIILVIAVIITAVITKGLVRPKYILQDSEIVLRAEAGDSIWGMCEEYTPKHLSIKEWVKFVEIYNDMEDHIIMVGESLHIPIFDEDQVNNK